MRLYDDNYFEDLPIVSTAFNNGSTKKTQLSIDVTDIEKENVAFTCMLLEVRMILLIFSFVFIEIQYLNYLVL